MKKLLFTLLFFGIYFISSAQNQPNVGDELMIKAPNGQTYNHIKFPKPNILIKRGKVGNYKSIYDNTVVIDEVLTKDDGTAYVILKKKDGTKFFGFLSKVKANYAKAIGAKELKVLP